MPLFFFCSGLFFKPTNIAKGFKKDVKMIIIPYVFFASILIMTLIGIGCVTHNNLRDAVGQLKINPLDSNCYPLYHTIWFLICLFFVKGFLNIFCKLTTIRTLGWGGYFVAFILRNNDIHLPFFIDSAFGMLFFYAVGYRFIHSKYHQMRCNTYILLLLLCLYLVLISFISPKVNVRDNMYPWFLCVSALVPIFLLFYLSANIFRADLWIFKIIRKSGVKSLFIFALHGPILEVLFPIMGHINIGNYAQTIILVLIIIPICLWAERMITKYTPFLVGK